MRTTQGHPATFRLPATRVLLLLVVLIGFTSYGQIGVGANFGVEAECYSGEVVAGFTTDDWFLGPAGFGVVDETTAQTNGYQALLQAGNNIAFDLRQSIPNYSTNSSYIWYSTRYGRDYTGISLLDPDLTAFGVGKNGDNPETDWSISTSDVNSKTDIVDSGVHMRRDGDEVTDDLWVDLMISTVASSGNHFIDFELFVSEIQVSGSNFINSGSQEGHTAWEFDANGNVTQIGDMVIGFGFSGSGVADVEVRLWVDRAIFDPGNSPGGTTSFIWGNDIDGGSTYGYGTIIVPPGALFSNVNSAPTQAPPWGTTNDLVGYSSQYLPGFFAEVGINFTQLGFDPRALFGSGAACDSPFSAVLTKSRNSSSFTSALSDFAGPYDFLGSAAGTQVNTEIQDPGAFDSCQSGETRTLQATFSSPSAEYTWYSLTDGVTFPGGSVTLTGVGLDEVVIDTPGNYQLGIAPLLGCDPVTDDSNILGVWSTPCLTGEDYSLFKGNTLNISAPGLLDNDTDVDPGDVLSVTTVPVVDVAHGSLTLNADGSFQYIPDPGYVGTDSFTYEVCDSHGLCETEVVTLNIRAGALITNRRITYRVNN